MSTTDDIQKHCFGMRGETKKVVFMENSTFPKIGEKKIPQNIFKSTSKKSILE